MSDILVSIIINNYNYGRYLKEAIDSILNQDYKNIELIVVDDGSTDNSQQLILEYGDKLIAILKENGGQASAFNAGWRKAGGELILFLDADDYLFSYAVSNVVKIYCKNNKQCISKLQFNLKILSNDNTVAACIPSNNDYSNSEEIIEKILLFSDYQTPPTSGNVFLSDFLKKVMPMPEDEYRLCADAYLLFTAPFMGEVFCINKNLGIYRIHGNNGWSESSKTKMTLARLKFIYTLNYSKHNLINTLCEKKNIKGWKRKYPIGFWRATIVLKKYDYLKMEKTMLSIFLSAVAATLEEKGILKKISILFWMITVFIVPKKMNFVHKFLLDNWNLRGLKRKIMKPKMQCLNKNEST